MVIVTTDASRHGDLPRRRGADATTAEAHQRDEYRLIEENEDCAHIVAVDADGTEICGAFQSPGAKIWRLYVTALAVQRARMVQFPRPVYCARRDEARDWVSVIAGLYAGSGKQ